MHTKNNEKDSYLVSPQTYESWQTLLEAAKIRNHNLIMDAAKQLGDKELPKIYYHRNVGVFYYEERLGSSDEEKKKS